MKTICLNGSQNEPVLIGLGNEWGIHISALASNSHFCFYPGKYHYLDQFSLGKKDSKVGMPTHQVQFVLFTHSHLSCSADIHTAFRLFFNKKYRMTKMASFSRASLNIKVKPKAYMILSVEDSAKTCKYIHSFSALFAQLF